MTSSITRVFCFSWPTLRNAHCGRHPQGLLTALSSILENPSENPSHTHTHTKEKKNVQKKLFFFFFFDHFWNFVNKAWNSGTMAEKWKGFAFLSFILFLFFFFFFGTSGMLSSGKAMSEESQGCSENPQIGIVLLAISPIQLD